MWRLFKAPPLLTAAATAAAAALTNRSLNADQSAARGGSCSVYLIGIAHGTQESREAVKAMIEFVKPEVVFVELCSSRHDFTSNPEVARGEFYVANTEAMKLGAKVILGDRPNEVSYFSYRYMSATLLEVARKHKSVVAVVGADHLRGIQEHWK